MTFNPRDDDSASSNPDEWTDEQDEEILDLDPRDVDAAALSDLAEDLEAWAGADLEAAYMKAMSALEASEVEFPRAASNSNREVDLEDEDETAGSSPTPLETVKARATEIDESATLNIDPEVATELLSTPVEIQAVTAPAEPVSAPEARLTPRQIIEACLFVGGVSLTAKKLAGVLRGDFDSDDVEREINELNRQYAAECRPYEIRLTEGGYCMALREEFERIRNKVYGLGPKEVRLSQDALEVLAVVAYHQPINQKAVEELGKPNCGAVLRQLVRRELLSVERDPKLPREVNYKTTPRFLSLFGIRNLDDLPRHEQISYK